MDAFVFSRLDQADAVVGELERMPGARLLGGGTNLIDLMRQGVESASELIDINRLGLDAIEPTADGGLRLGATARNSDTAAHPLVRQGYPLLSQAILAGASPQLRNMATNAGNLLQRTRCYYFYDPQNRECNKRRPGSGCAAIGGFNRIHAIVGADVVDGGSSAACIATHPSDMCVALAALGAEVRVLGPGGERVIPFAEFHRLPGDRPQEDTTLRRDELILSIDLPPSPYAERSCYLKVRDRASYAFALVSVAAALEMDGDRIRSARVALGGVAHAPWRMPEAEQLLAGAKADEEAFRAAAARVLAGAVSYEHNAFKVPLAHDAVVRALTLASRGEAAPLNTAV